MHETVLMQNLIATATQVLENRPVARVNRVILSVGRFSNALPDALLFAFKAMAQKGILKGAELEIENMPASAQCDDCGHEYQADKFPLVCPLCKSTGFRIISGEEVYLKSIDYEEK